MDTTTQQSHAPAVASEQSIEGEQPIEQDQPSAPIPSDKTPQEFYAEIIKRADVRAILEELATG